MGNKVQFFLDVGCEKYIKLELQKKKTKLFLVCI